MKFNKSILFLIFSSLIFIAAFSFSNYRYYKKINLEIQIIFTNPPRFFNDSLVNKLLTQNLIDKYTMRKDSLDLNILEIKMNNIPEVENTEIFLLPDGRLTFYIKERVPLFIVDSDPALYSDANGALFDFKVIDSIKYPKFKTVSSTISFETTASVIKNMTSDKFLSNELEYILLEKNQFQLKLKSYDFDVKFGTPINVNDKIKKLKIFCAYQKTQDSLNRYQEINLSYNNQVVAVIP